MTTAARRKATRQRHLLYARACGVSAYIPRPEFVAAAQEGTDGMLALFTHYGCRMTDLPVLVRSAYLQGAWDAATMAAKMYDGQPHAVSEER